MKLIVNQSFKVTRNLQHEAVDVVIGQAEGTHQNRAFNRVKQAGNRQGVLNLPRALELPQARANRTQGRNENLVVNQRDRRIVCFTGLDEQATNCPTIRAKVLAKAELGLVHQNFPRAIPAWARATNQSREGVLQEVIAGFPACVNAGFAHSGSAGDLGQVESGPADLSLECQGTFDDLGFDHFIARSTNFGRVLSRIRHDLHLSFIAAGKRHITRTLRVNACAFRELIKIGESSLYLSENNTQERRTR